MVHTVASLAFFLVAAGGLGVIVMMLHGQREAIVAALNLQAPAMPIQAQQRRVRIRSVRATSFATRVSIPSRYAA